MHWFATSIEISGKITGLFLLGRRLVSIYSRWRINVPSCVMCFRGRLTFTLSLLYRVSACIHPPETHHGQIYLTEMMREDSPPTGVRELTHHLRQEDLPVLTGVDQIYITEVISPQYLPIPPSHELWAEYSMERWWGCGLLHAADSTSTKKVTCCTVRRIREAVYGCF